MDATRTKKNKLICRTLRHGQLCSSELIITQNSKVLRQYYSFFLTRGRLITRQIFFLYFL